MLFHYCRKQHKQRSPTKGNERGSCCLWSRQTVVNSVNGTRPVYGTGRAANALVSLQLFLSTGVCTFTLFGGIEAVSFQTVTMFSKIVSASTHYARNPPRQRGDKGIAFKRRAHRRAFGGGPSARALALRCADLARCWELQPSLKTRQQ